MAIDVSTLAPGDAVVALRSLRRRWGAALAALEAVEPHEAAERLARPGPDGLAVADRIASTTEALHVLDAALADVLTHTEPALERDVLADPGVYAQPGEAGTSGLEPDLTTVEDRVGALAQAAEAMADRAERVQAEDWGRVGRVGPDQVSALDLLRRAVAVGVDGLRATEKSL